MNQGHRVYRLFVPKQAVGANLIYFDFFNAAGSASDVHIYSVIPVVSGAVAVVGTLGVDLFLNRTSAVGTGGTAATVEGTSFTAMTISTHDHTQPLDLSKITARLTPTGGATAGAVLAWSSVFTEETSAPTYNAYWDLARQHYPDMPPIRVQEGSGFSVVQGAVASVGNIGFNVVIGVQLK